MTLRHTGASPERRQRPMNSDELELLMAAMKEAGGNRTRAAKILGISRSSLYYKLNKYSWELGWRDDSK
ncbi:hypothetical protein SY88_15360 [Clostridiales bacterium PH28_bin88]|nr:hypothetical protein SY88_15360 [Clostridiales bacterium PH28_bin88]